MAGARAIKPWMVAVTLACIGIVGATYVYFAAQTQHRIDRSDIARWEQLYLPVANDAARIHSSLPSLTTIQQIRAARAKLQQDRAFFLRDQVPDIVRPVTARFVGAIDSALRALSKRDTSGGTVVASSDTSFKTSWNDANTRFSQARTALRDLVCRAGLRACGSSESG